MNDIANPAPLPNSQVIAAGAASPVASMTPDAIAAEYAVVQRQIAGNTSAHAKAPLLNRLEALAAARWPSSGDTPGALPKGDSSGLDPRNDPAFKQAMASNSHAERANAINHLQRFEEAENAAAQPMTEAELARFDAMVEPRDIHDYQLQGAHAEGQTLARDMLEMGVSPAAFRSIDLVFDRVEAMDEIAYGGEVQKAASMVRALPGGSGILKDAQTFLDALKKLPATDPKRVMGEVAAASHIGIQEMARLQRRQARKSA